MSNVIQPHINLPKETTIFLDYIFQYLNIKEDEEYFYLPCNWMSAGEELERLLIDQGLCKANGDHMIKIPKSLYHND